MVESVTDELLCVVCRFAFLFSCVIVFSFFNGAECPATKALYRPYVRGVRCIAAIVCLMCAWVVVSMQDARHGSDDALRSCMAA